MRTEKRALELVEQMENARGNLSLDMIHNFLAEMHKLREEGAKNGTHTDGGEADRAGGPDRGGRQGE